MKDKIIVGKYYRSPNCCDICGGNILFRIKEGSGIIHHISVSYYVDYCKRPTPNKIFEFVRSGIYNIYKDNFIKDEISKIPITSEVNINIVDLISNLEKSLTVSWIKDFDQSSLIKSLISGEAEFF